MKSNIPTTGTKSLAMTVIVGLSMLNIIGLPLELGFVSHDLCVLPVMKLTIP